MNRIGYLRLWVSLSLALLGTSVLAGSAVIEGFPDSKLEIRTAAGRHWFNIAVADTPERQQRGLMFVRELPADHGMLFPERPARVMTMWMKNTLISLDMLFIDVQGRVVCIRDHAKPESEDIITCGQPVGAVLELRGGEAARRGIKIGDLVVHSTFSP